MIRQPIVSVLGHVDAGKTTLLDYIRGSVVAEREAGGITQMIGATAVPIEKIEEVCGPLLQQMETDLQIPGLLFIDTPGHAAFTSLRKRGGSLSDIAVVVVDVNSGVQPQTREAISILKESSTPFVIALNKIDTIQGWQTTDTCFVKNYAQQRDRLQQRLDEVIYELMGVFNEMDFIVDRYDRIDDFKKKVAIVPISAHTGEGMPDLLMTLSGLSQRFLADRLELHTGMGQGTVLEVNPVKGFGTTIDVILYDGTINKDDTLVVGTADEPIVTSIKALLEPAPLKEIRTEKRFESIDDVGAAAGIKVAAPNLDTVIAGVPVRAVKNEEDVADAVADVKAEIESYSIETQSDGVIVRADSLGSLEALLDFIGERDIPVKKADVGAVTKQDVVEAEHESGTNRAVLVFNTGMTDAAERYIEDTEIALFRSDIIYELVDQYEEWVASVEQQQQETVLAAITRPAHIRLLPDHVFRSSNPAVVGVEVINGVLNAGSSLMKRDGTVIGKVKAIQDEGESVDTAEKGDEVAISISSVTVGRQIDEGDELYTNLTGKDYRIVKERQDAFTAHELQVLETIVEIKDRQDPRWKLK